MHIFSSLSTTDKIQIISILATSIISIVSVSIAVAALKQNSKITKEANRAYIVFYIDKTRSNPYFDLIIKNFGKSGGKLLGITLTPQLSYGKSKFGLQNLKVLTDCKDIYLAPNQSVCSVFNFEDYPDREFEVVIKYETLGEICTESYTINLNHRDSMLTASSNLDSMEDTLKHINKSIQEVSDRLL